MSARLHGRTRTPAGLPTRREGLSALLLLVEEK